MRGSLFGDDARIWELHSQGFPMSHICALVGTGEARVRTVICAVWYEDKLTGGRSRRG